MGGEGGELLTSDRYAQLKKILKTSTDPLGVVWKNEMVLEKNCVVQ